MTIKATARGARAIPNTRPPKPPPPRVALTVTERWYVDCLAALSKHLRRSASLPELATYVNRAVTPCYVALLRAEKKGYVRRNKTRQFVVVEGAR